MTQWYRGAEQHASVNGSDIEELENGSGDQHTILPAKRTKWDIKSYTFHSISDCINWVGRRKTGNSTRRVERINERCQGKLEKIDGDENKDSLRVCNSKGLTNGDSKGQNGTITGNVERAGTLDKQHTQVLITGSIHLVGGALRVLQNMQECDHKKENV